MVELWLNCFFLNICVSVHALSILIQYASAFFCEILLLFVLHVVM